MSIKKIKITSLITKKSVYELIDCLIAFVTDFSSQASREVSTVLGRLRNQDVRDDLVGFQPVRQTQM